MPPGDRRPHVASGLAEDPAPIFLTPRYHAGASGDRIPVDQCRAVEGREEKEACQERNQHRA